jgi:hypothetical protein
MTTPQQYHEKADACLRKAENAQDPHIQLRFRTVAFKYRELAELIQDGPKLPQ